MFSTGMRKGVRPALRLQPERPVDVFLNWAAVFVAQGMLHWVADFRVAKDPDEASTDDTEEDHVELFQRRREFFAAQVLGSSTLHVTGAGNLMLWKDWGAGSDICDGRVTKGELLTFVSESGIGLPYGAPNAENWREGSSPGYRVYGYRLKRIVEGFPPLFGEQILKFDVEMLEWFAVLLGIGVRMVERENSVEKTLDVAGKTLDDTDEDSTDGSNCAGETRSTEQEFDSGDLAMENLELQLGFMRGELSYSAEPLKNLWKHMAVPVLSQDVMSISRCNRLVLEVGEFIDLWIALVSGERVDFLLRKNTVWSELCLGTHRRKVPEHLQYEALGRIHDGRLANDKSFDLTGIHAELEMASREFEYAKPKQSYWHMEQTLTFMGYDMEFVRSAMANWIGTSSGVEDIKLSPKIPYDVTVSAMMTRPVFIGNLSPRFVRALEESSDLYTHLRKRSVQVRLLWEVRGLLQQKLGQFQGGPSSAAAMMLCLLAFPALSVKVSKSQTDEHNTSFSKPRGSEVLPVSMKCLVDPFDGKDKSISLQSVGISIQPGCGPQRLSVFLRFQVSAGTARVKASIVRSDGTEDTGFQWRWWRDAFCGRLSGIAEWQKAHKYSSGEVRITDGSIGRGIRTESVNLNGTGEFLRLWDGWLPFRVKISRAELLSPGFLVDYQEARKTSQSYMGILHGGKWTSAIPQEGRVVVSYSTASRKRLRHACFVIEEVLDKRGRLLSVKTRNGNAEARGKMIVEYANNLIAEKGSSLDRALYFLEIAAFELRNMSALQRFVELFLTKRHIPRGISDVVSLVSCCSYVILKAGSEKNTAPTDATAATNAAKILSIYSMLLDSRKHGHDAALIREFTAWVDFMLFTKLTFNGQYWIPRIRCLFTSSRNFDLLATLGEVCSWRDNAQDKSNVVCRAWPTTRPKQQVAFPNRKVNIGEALRIQLYERAAHEGNIPRALFNLANIYRDGTTKISADIPKAISLYEKAIAEHNFVPAMITLGALLSNPAVHNSDPQTAVQLYQRAIYEQGSLDAMFNLGNLLQVGGRNVPPNIPRAMELYNRAAEGGHSSAMVNMAALLYYGEHIEKDTERAIKLLERAISTDAKPVAMYNLALILLSSTSDKESSTARGIELLESASQQGHTLASLHLADLLVKGGENLAKDSIRAAELYSKAGTEGSGEAMLKLANLLCDGDGQVENDWGKARELYETVAKAGGGLARRAHLGLGVLMMKEEAERILSDV